MGTTESTPSAASITKPNTGSISTSEPATAPPSEVEVLPQCYEWEAGQDSDDDADEKEKEGVLQRHASQQFEIREKRLSAVTARLQNDISLGDVDIEVLHQQKEWAALADSDDEEWSAAAKHDAETAVVADHEAEVFAKRERRLTARSATLELAKVLGDAEVEVVALEKEWDADLADGLAADDSPGHRQKHHTALFEVRERRLTATTDKLATDGALGDVDVEIVAQDKEWKCLEDSDAEEDQEGEVPEQLQAQLQRRASASFEQRERRLSIAADVLQSDRSIGDAKVEVLVESQEWSGLADVGEDDNAAASTAAATSAVLAEGHEAELFQRRERRLTLGAEALQAVDAVASAQ
mmetsp:Transcript_51484/g.122437  ORF Transcript_51484/g.122437 Transcript_51484/m.122437 type:complete len:353 (+) Transcript_51484:101-1159(+)